MPRRQILTDRSRSALFDLPTDEASLLQHYTLADDDIEHIRERRLAHNQIGFALQLCAFRYPGRLLEPSETIPLEVSNFVAAQLGLNGEELAGYAENDMTRRRHLIDLRTIYGYRMFTGRGARDLKQWLEGQAEQARSNEDLARRFVEECRRLQIILPAISSIERLSADALVSAERRIEARIVSRLGCELQSQLDALLAEDVDGRLSRFIWLRQFEVGNNSADANRLLDKLEVLQTLEMPSDLFDSIPPHRITRLRRQGERYFTDGLKDITSDRSLAILAVCVVEWKAAIADAIVETHDRIVGKTWREANKFCDARFANSKAAVQSTLQGFSSLGAGLIEAHNDGVPLEGAITTIGGWEALEQLVAMAAQLTDTMASEPTGLSVPYEPFEWLADRKARMAEGLDRLAKAARQGAIPGGSIENGSLMLDRLTADVPAEADHIVLDLYRRLPEVRITDILIDVDRATGFTDAFTHLRTGVPCQDKVGLLNVLLAEGLNLGLSKMAEASNTHEYFQLSRLSRWHIESDAINQALAIVIEAQSDLPMAQFWGAGVTASSDGQFFPSTRQGEAMNLINAKYGSDPGLKAYTHVSDQFSPFATQDIPATVSEAPYILDGLLMNPTGRKIKEQYADTGGFTDHVFAVTSIERTLFIIDWLLDADMQRRAQIGLNKGEAHHALKNALRIGRQGEIRDRTAEAQHYRMAGLNLLAAIIIYWNTNQLGKAVQQRKRAGLDCSPELLSHISPLGWAHILLTGEYRWPNHDQKPL